MVISETKIRVRYGETDQMGFAYYGYYPFYYEVGRTDLIRKLGLSYKKMEENGILLPVIALNVEYKIPATYDEEITIKTYLKEIPSVRIQFFYELMNEQSQLINTGNTTLVFIDKNTKKPTKAPKMFLDKVIPFFNTTQ